MVLFNKMRAAYRFAIYPCKTSTPNIGLDNKNIWLQMRSWLYWALVLLQLIPYYAVGIGFFLLDFVLIDKTDEY